MPDHVDIRGIIQDLLDDLGSEGYLGYRVTGKCSTFQSNYCKLTLTQGGCDA